MISKSLEALPVISSEQKVYLAIGRFDGVHRGHQALIDRILVSAKRDKGIAAILTFWPDPSRVLRPENPTLLIMPPEVKHDYFLEQGIDLVIQEEFTLAFSKIKAEAFLPLLTKYIPRLSSIAVGEDFRFGYKRLGNVETLKKEAEGYGIEVFSIPRITHDKEVITSTRIRKELLKGNIEEANKLLGHPYFSVCKVVEGSKEGRKLGFPTLNMEWHPELKPKYGVYAVKVKMGHQGSLQNGVANYGIRPTLTHDKDPTLEVHLFETPDAVETDDKLRVEWHFFLRAEEKYADKEALKIQIAKDKALAFGMLMLP